MKKKTRWNVSLELCSRSGWIGAHPRPSQGWHGLNQTSWFLWQLSETQNTNIQWGKCVPKKLCFYEKEFFVRCVNILRHCTAQVCITWSRTGLIICSDCLSVNRAKVNNYQNVRYFHIESFFDVNTIGWHSLGLLAYGQLTKNTNNVILSTIKNMWNSYNVLGTISLCLQTIFV